MVDPALLETVSVPLALEDGVPVLLSAAGMVVLARGIVKTRLGHTAGRLALAGAILIAAGGMSKVLWKVLLAGFERDVEGLDDLLFPLLAGGFYILMNVVAAARKRPGDPRYVVRTTVAGAVGAVGMVLSLSAINLEMGLRIGLIVTIVGSLTLSWHVAAMARERGDRFTAGLIAVHVAATFALSGMARIESQTLALQWVEQSINTVSQGLFLFAAIRLVRLVRAQPNPRRGDGLTASRPEASEVAA